MAYFMVTMAALNGIRFSLIFVGGAIRGAYVSTAPLVDRDFSSPIPG